MTVYPLRDYQEATVTAAHNFIRYRSGHGYIKAPGGSGKSIMIAALAEMCVDMGLHVIMLARNETLLRQNKAKLASEYQLSCGIYCASLGEKDLTKQITIASIQSICGADDLPHFDIALVDECDEIPENQDGDSQYWTFFRNAELPRIVGFTATPYRLATGTIQWGDEIIAIPLPPLIDAGYLVPPSNKAVEIYLDDVKVSVGGDYAVDEISKKYLDPELLEISVSKLLAYGDDRNHVLVFTQSLEHSDFVAAALEVNDCSVMSVSGDTPKEELKDVLERFEAGEFKYLMNCQLLTVGIDLPCIDMIALLRATKSKRLFEQCVFRGTRPNEGKDDFLLFDMGNNLLTHGPLGSPYTGKKGKRDATQSQGKICPECEDFVTPINCKECADCGFIFPEPEDRTIDHNRNVDTTTKAIWDNSENMIAYQIDGVSYGEHISRKSGNTSLRVDYFCADAPYGNISEWISVYSDNEWARNKASQFFQERGIDCFGLLADMPMEKIIQHAEKLKKPSQIMVDHSEKYPRIKKYVWGEVAKVENLEDKLDDFIPY